MALEARAITTVYVPLPTDGDKPVETTTVYLPLPTGRGKEVETATVTVTQTVTPALQTVTKTWGRTWTTATPYQYTRTDIYPTPHVVITENYPSQPQWQQYYNRCSNRTGAIVGSFFGGLGLGLLICAVMMMIMAVKFRRLKRSIAAGESVDAENHPADTFATRVGRGLRSFGARRAGTGAIRLPVDKETPRNSEEHEPLIPKPAEVVTAST